MNYKFSEQNYLICKSKLRVEVQEKLGTIGANGSQRCWGKFKKIFSFGFFLLSSDLFTFFMSREEKLKNKL